MTNKQQLNVSIPSNVHELVDYYSNLLGMSKRELVVKALTQFMAIEQERHEYETKHPGTRVKTKVYFESIYPEEKNRGAAVLLY